MKIVSFCGLPLLDIRSFQPSNKSKETENTELNQKVNAPSGIDSDIDDDIPF